MSTFKLYILPNVTKLLDTEANQDFQDQLYNYSINGFELRERDEDEGTPVPWDASIEVTDVAVILRGCIGPMGRGVCTCTISKSEFDNYYSLTVQAKEDCEARLKALLLTKGFGVEVIEASPSDHEISY
jgi:hypothetical protein